MKKENRVKTSLTLPPDLDKLVDKEIKRQKERGRLLSKSSFICEVLYSHLLHLKK